LPLFRYWNLIHFYLVTVVLQLEFPLILRHLSCLAFFRCNIKVQILPILGLLKRMIFGSPLSRDEMLEPWLHIYPLFPVKGGPNAAVHATCWLLPDDNLRQSHAGDDTLTVVDLERNL
jgi:hypothetical protein